MLQFFNLNYIQYIISCLQKKNLINIKSIISYYIVLLNLLSSPSIEKKERDRGKEERKGGREGGKKKGKEGERKEGKNEKRKKDRRKKKRKRKKGKQERKVGSSGREPHSSENGLLMYFFFYFPKHLFEASHNDISLEFPEKEHYENCLAQQSLFLIDEEYPDCQRRN